ncbi:MAG: DUF1631 domain-containing protein [Gammaproteobacteria bacterium]|nr:DUF1631 domain-containing protein [Gammaproteobacteria bacterium]
MSNQPGIHYIHPHRSGDRKPCPPLAEKVRDSACGLLGDFLQGAFDAVDDSLFEMANNARNNNDQNRLFESMREVRIKRRAVERHFRHQIHLCFEAPPSSSDDAQPARNRTLESLALVQNDELEEQVAINSMVTKATANCQGALIPLQARFSVVYDKADNPVNPLSPTCLCRAFASACEELDLHIRERLILLKQFDRYIINNLGMVYDEANRILVQGGVLPDYRSRIRSNPDMRTAAATASTYSAPDTTADSERVFEQIRSLLASRRPARYGAAATGDASVAIIGGPELVQLLAKIPVLPQGAADTDDLARGEPMVIDLRQTVQQLLAQQKGADGQSARLSEMDEDLINLVSMLFEFILDDRNLSAPIQVLISRLQIPILKVVIKDKGFFSKSSHPARRLLNALAKAGIGWSSSDERQRDKLYDQIHNVVQRILNEFNGDLSLFEQLHDEFDQFLTRENRKANIVEQRTQEAERGRIKSQRAQEVVEQVLREKLAGQTLPPVASDILLNGWSRVMFLAYLRNDAEGRWEPTLAVLDDLIWCLRPHSDASEREVWVRRVPPLLRGIRAGLQEVSYNSSRLDELMAQLKQALTQVFREQAAAHADQSGTDTPASPVQETRQAQAADVELAPAEPSAKPKTAVSRQRELEDAAIAEYVARLDEIGVGSWVEFNLVNGTRFRCKLSAIIEDADCFVFVNRMGLKVVEKSRYELAHELRRGRLTMLEQGALIDRAMDAVVGTLRRKAG